MPRLSAVLPVLGWLSTLTTVPAAAAPPALSAEDRAAIFEAAGLRARDGGYTVDGCSTLLKPQTEVVDFNSDGQPEVLLYVVASRCFASSAGGNVALFVRDADGRWVDRFGFLPGVEVVAQPDRQQGWPDLGVANPGGCMPIYRWNGSAYAYHSQKALQPGGCQFRE